MKKETYLSRDSGNCALRFPAQAKELNTAFDMRLSALLAENADASKESNTTSSGRYCRALRPTRPCSRSCRKRRHCKPFTAMWSGWRERAINSLPPCCTYRALPPCSRRFRQIHPDVFTGGGLAPKELQTGNGVWRVDMMKCPYHDICTEYGCPERAAAFATVMTSAIPGCIRS
ncbi:MAG: hypothetical protein ACLS5C_03930 [Waltera sp.]